MLLLLMQPNIDINSSNNDKNTALMWAVFTGLMRIVKSLLNHPDIDINLPNKYGDTPLMVVLQEEHLETAYMLLEQPFWMSVLLIN